MYYVLLTTCGEASYLLLTMYAYYSLFTTYYLLLATCVLLLTTCSLLLTAHILASAERLLLHASTDSGEAEDIRLPWAGALCSLFHGQGERGSI